MNSTSPLVPQGSSMEQHNKARSSLRVKIFCAIGVNVAVLLVLLMQGCKREQPPADTTVTDVPAVYDDANLPPIVTEYDTAPTNESGAMIDGQAGAMTPEHPVVPEIPTVPPPSLGTEYKIQRGDTFSSIAPKFNITVPALQAANPNVDPTKLQINQKITIPAPSGAPAASSAPVINAATGETLYTVKSGDTLSRIATQFHTSVAAIKTANGLSTDRIKVGDKLKIPAKSN